jgi:hypothetical protein
MKKLIYFAFIAMLPVFLFTSCSEDFIGIEEQVEKQRKRSLAVLECDKMASGSFDEAGQYHIYPRVDMNLSCLRGGREMFITVNAADVPNRFRVLDPNGNVVTIFLNGTNTPLQSTDWIGSTTFTGPWGQPFSNNNTTKTYRFFTTVPGIYQVEVETSTPSNGDDDYWWMSFCECPPPPPNGDTTGVNDCGASFNGSFNGNGFHIYPLEAINLQNISAGTRICITFNVESIPNRFRLLDGSQTPIPFTDMNGVSVPSSGWVGYANYFGPWSNGSTANGGISNGPGIRTYSFIKGTGDDYFMEIETSTALHLNHTDAWSFTVLCDCPYEVDDENNQGGS